MKWTTTPFSVGTILTLISIMLGSFTVLRSDITDMQDSIHALASRVIVLETYQSLRRPTNPDTPVFKSP